MSSISALGGALQSQVTLQLEKTDSPVKTVQNVSPANVEAFEQEANVMKSLRPHGNVVLFQGVSFWQNQIMLVTGSNLVEI